MGLAEGNALGVTTGLADASGLWEGTGLALGSGLALAAGLGDATAKKQERGDGTPTTSGSAVSNARFLLNHRAGGNRLIPHLDQMGSSPHIAIHQTARLAHGRLYSAPSKTLPEKPLAHTRAGGGQRAEGSLGTWGSLGTDGRRRTGAGLGARTGTGTGRWNCGEDTEP